MIVQNPKEYDGRHHASPIVFRFSCSMLQKLAITPEIIGLSLHQASKLDHFNYAMDLSCVM